MWSPVSLTDIQAHYSPLNYLRSTECFWEFVAKLLSESCFPKKPASWRSTLRETQIWGNSQDSVLSPVWSPERLCSSEADYSPVDYLKSIGCFCKIVEKVLQWVPFPGESSMVENCLGKNAILGKFGGLHLESRLEPRDSAQDSSRLEPC